MVIVSARSGNSIPTSVDASGRFEALLELTSARTRSRCAARTRPATCHRLGSCWCARTATRRWCSPSRRPRSDAATLPTRLEIVATVHDEHGQPIDDALVTFGLSPPSLATTITTERRTSGGVADLAGRRHPGVRQLERYLAGHRTGDALVGRRATSGRVAYRESERRRLAGRRQIRTDRPRRSAACPSSTGVAPHR